MVTRVVRVGAFVVMSLLAAGCVGGDGEVDSAEEPIVERVTVPPADDGAAIDSDASGPADGADVAPAGGGDEARPAVPAATAGAVVVGRTDFTAEGNRTLTGRAALLGVEPVEIELPEPVKWIVGIDRAAAVDAGVVDPPEWVVVGFDGSVSGVTTCGSTADGGSASVVPLGTSDPSVRPGVVVDDGRLVVVAASSIAAPVTDPTDVPDAGVVTDADGVRAWYDGATDRYPHGVLGDLLEGSQLVIEVPVEAEGAAASDDGSAESVAAERERVTVTLADGVFEGLTPMLVDLDGDGTSEVLTTESAAGVGARLALYDLDGSRRAESRAIGLGNRWRHQLAAAPTGPNGETEIVEVQTPHIGGIVQFVGLDGDRLVVRSGASPFRSHTIGSIDLDRGVIVDVDGPTVGSAGAERREVVVASQDLTELAVLAHVGGDAPIAELGRLPLGGTLVSNIAAVARPADPEGSDGGTVAIAVATEDGRLLIWP